MRCASDYPSAAALAKALGGLRAGNGFLCRCPAHDDTKPSLSITDGKHGHPLLNCLSGCAFIDVAAALVDRGLWPASHGREEDTEEARRERQERDRKAAAARLDEGARARAKAASDLLRAKEILRESFSPTPGSTVGIYLIARGIDPPWPPCIRQHPRLYHRDGAGRVSHHPAMVAPIRDVRTDEVIGVHRTYLAEGGGKADVDESKKVLGRLLGGAIKLSPDEDVTIGLGVAEGIETALSVLSELSWSPVWALATSRNLTKLPVLPGIGALTIFGDNDDHKTSAGEKAAHACADRWRAAGREVTLWIPKGIGVDWNDELGVR